MLIVLTKKVNILTANKLVKLMIMNNWALMCSSGLEAQNDLGLHCMCIPCEDTFLFDLPEIMKYSEDYFGDFCTKTCPSLHCLPLI